MLARVYLLRALRVALLALAGLVVFCLLYGLAAWASAKLPSKGRAQAAAPDAGGIYLCEAAFHTDFAMPMNDPAADWPAALGHLLPAGMPEDTYLLFGWGDYRFFTEVFELGDLSPAVALSALAGFNETAVRTVPVSAADVRTYCRLVPVDAAGRAAIIAHVSETFERDADGTVQTLPTDVYGETLIRAHGRYSPFNTCNQWTASGLGKAGLPRAAFAPFTFSIMWPLDAGAPESNSPAQP